MDKMDLPMKAFFSFLRSYFMGRDMAHRFSSCPLGSFC